MNTERDITLDFNNCSFLEPNAVAFLGGLVRLLQLNNRQVFFRADRSSSAFKFLSKNGFLDNLSDIGSTTTSNTAIPFRQDIDKDKDDIISYLSHAWLEGHNLKLSDKLRNELAGKVWEIYDNAFSHAESPVGIISYGQFYPNLKLLKLTVIDFGVGIPHNVRAFLENPNYPANTAMEWAFTFGNTTQTGGISRGLGLDLLKDFIKLNKGKLEVFSHEGYTVLNSEREEYKIHEPYFGGTLVNITFNCDADKTSYKFEGEIDEVDIESDEDFNVWA